MSDQGRTVIPPGWYPDPENPAHGRFWNGAEWTDVRHIPGEPLPFAPPIKAPAGTDWNTPWIWLIIGLPLLPMVFLLLVPWGSLFDFDPSAATPAEGMGGMAAVFLSPFYWLSIVLSYGIYGLSVWFAFRDMRELAARGVPKPFHWAFAFIGGLVYTIGRSVVVTRRTGRGHAPMWAEIGVVVLSIVVVVIVEVMIFSAMGELMTTFPTPR